MVISVQGVSVLGSLSRGLCPGVSVQGSLSRGISVWTISVPWRGISVGRPPPQTRKAGGTHPTGMLSYAIKFTFEIKF